MFYIELLIQLYTCHSPLSIIYNEIPLEELVVMYKKVSDLSGSLSSHAVSKKRKSRFASKGKPTFFESDQSYSSFCSLKKSLGISRK